VDGAPEQLLKKQNPLMTKRLPAAGIVALVVLLGACALAPASERRQTPLVKAVERAKVSVVNIHSEKTTRTGDALFTGSKGKKVNGMGTGIVVDERGYIVTNHHVVHEVDTLRCTLFDGSTYNAQVVSTDREHDLAIIKIDATRPLTVMPLGTSSDLMLGETVIAVGNAYGYEHTVTAGIISALSRDVEVNEKQSYKNLIQTDASINPGNSGGPLLNLDGEVVGINVAIRAGAQRIGFAIPIDDARRVLAALLSVEKLSHTQHGVVARDVKSADRRLLIVEETEANSPAAAAGLRAGDVVVKAGTVDVTDAADFERALLGRAAGETIDVQVRRDGTPLALALTLSEAARQRRQITADNSIVRANNGSQTTTIEDKAWQVLGVKLARMAPGERPSVGPRYRGGMRVVDVRPSSAAAINGIQPGDLLVGLHIWETLTHDNIAYVLDHPQFTSFNPVKFYIIRGNETLYGHLRVATAANE
jgi:serine protease Do